MTAKDKLLKAAKELFSKKGYHETTVDEIVERANLSKGAFYFYFKKKEDILKELINILSENMIKNLERHVNTSKSVEEILISCVSDFFEMFYKDKEIAYIFFFELLRTSEEFRRFHAQKTQRIREILSSLIERGIKSGEVKHDNVEVIVSLLMGFVRFLYLEKIFTDGLSLEEVKSLALEGVKIIVRGVKCGSF